MRRLSESTWFSNAAAVCSGIWGRVTASAAANQCSRQTAYRQAAIVQDALERCRDPQYGDLKAELDRLSLENCELWEACAESIQFPEARRKEFVARGTAMGLSLTAIRELLVVVLGTAQAPSRSQVGRWSQEAASAAGRILKILDQFARTMVVSICLDEIFFRRNPTLVVVDPLSMAWLAGERTADRSGATWHRILKPFENRGASPLPSNV
jgi:hypothetical protein